MSNGSAIATCSAVLQQMFQESLVGDDLAAALGSAPVVSVLPPDRITIGAAEAPQLNLFMYHVTPNTGWVNRETPSHAGTGNRRTAAPLGVDLHYMVSAYGTGNAQADVLLGHAALVLHEVRYLTRERVRQLGTSTGVADSLRNLLTASGLDDQEEMIRLTWEKLTIDDTSKLWSIFGERYRPSIAFMASVLVMRPDVETQAAPPVAVANLRVLPLPAARITGIEPTQAGVGDTITIQGSGLLSESTVVRFGGTADVVPPNSALPSEIVVDVPAGVQAGLSGIQVIHSVDFGPASDVKPVADSNIFPLLVRPVFAEDDIAVADPTVTVAISPEVGRNQRVRVLLDGTGALAGQQVVIDLPSRSLEPALTSPTIEFDRTDIAAGTYLIRVEVDGVSSELVAVTNVDGEATGDGFEGPEVVLP